MILDTSLAQKLDLIIKLGPPKDKNFCLECTHSQNPIVNETSFTIAFLYDLMVFEKIQLKSCCLREDLTL